MKFDEVVRQQLIEKHVYLDWRRLGIVTGLSPASSAGYYTNLCNIARGQLGDNNNPEFTTENVNFDLVEVLMNLDRWDLVEEYIAEAMLRLEKTGVEALAVCSNTIHRVLDSIQKTVKLPIIHIGDCVAADIKRADCLCVGLLGTKTTMEMDFIPKHLRKSGARIVVPDAKWHERINSIIFDELCYGHINPESTTFLLYEVIDDMVVTQGIDAVVLGCTELSLAINHEEQRHYIWHHSGFKFFDSEASHINGMLEFCKNGTLPQVG